MTLLKIRYFLATSPTGKPYALGSSLVMSW